MKISKETEANIRIADMSLLTALKEINTLSNKVAIFDNLEGGCFEGFYRLHGGAIIFIEKGSCSVEIDLKQYELVERSVLAILPNHVARFIRGSEDLKPLCIACSEDMLQELLPQIDDSFRIMLTAAQNPYLQWDKEDFKHVVESFRHIETKIQEAKQNVYYNQIVKHAILSLAYECIGQMTRDCKKVQSTSRKEILFNAFIDCVSKKHKEEHSVQYYADSLFVTPKYLSTVVENLSGKSAKQWIDEYLVLDAKVLLQSTQKDIQEISDELNFPNMSFFGKFFKRLAGISPKAFRAQGK